MKYDEEEIALAALLIAQAPAHEPLPEALERKIAAMTRAVSDEVRYTTTKAAALAVAPLPSAPVKRLRQREQIAWVAAAACFAFGVYEWRASTLSRDAAERAQATATSAEAAWPVVIAGHDGRGATLFALRWSDREHAGEVDVSGMQESAAGERYTLWLSGTDRARAVAVGAFTCRGDCGARVFGVRASPEVGPVRHAWLTKDPADGGVTALDGERILAEGHARP